MIRSRTAEPAGPFAQPRPSMRGRYLIRSRPKAIAMGLLDGLLSLVPGPRRPITDPPRCILVANWAHLGDVTTALGALSALRARYPDATIGMLVGSWGKPAVAATGLADRLHVVDHWRINRSDRPDKAKKEQYRRTRAAALKEIRATRYDVAIDVYPMFPPAHPVFRQAGIPVRIGYTSGGFGPLLTHPVPWSDDDRPMADHHRDLLDALSPDRPYKPGGLRPRRDPATLSPLPAELRDRSPYVVLHPGAGADYKDWGLPNWRALAERLRAEWPEVTLVVTGAGSGEVATAARLTAQEPRMVDMAGRADWEAFVSIVAHAELVICPDTATGHIAASLDVPVVSLFTGTNKAGQWGPYGDRARVLVRPVVCAPCNRAGCEVMACIRDVQVEDVVAAAAELLPSPASAIRV